MGPEFVGNIEQVTNVCRWIVLEQLQIRSEITSQQTPSDDDQHCAANSEKCFL